MSSQFVSMIQSLQSFSSVEEKLWHLKNNIGVDVDVDNLDSVVHKLEGLKFDQIITIYTITQTPAAAMAEELRC